MAIKIYNPNFVQLFKENWTVLAKNLKDVLVGAGIPAIATDSEWSVKIAGEKIVLTKKNSKRNDTIIVQRLVNNTNSKQLDNLVTVTFKVDGQLLSYDPFIPMTMNLDDYINKVRIAYAQYGVEL